MFAPLYQQVLSNFLAFVLFFQSFKVERSLAPKLNGVSTKQYTTMFYSCSVNSFVSLCNIVHHFDLVNQKLTVISDGRSATHPEALNACI